MNLVDTFDDQLDVFFGEATPTQAHVYGRLPRANWPVDAKLHGTISGPSCLYAQTLPASFRFVDRSLGDMLLAEAILPDPCFWTPGLPYLYQVDIQLRQGTNVLAEVSRHFGIRPLGTRGKNLVYAGKRWVLRGSAWWASPPTSLQEWHDAELAMIIAPPEENMAVETSKVGVFVVMVATQYHHLPPTKPQWFSRNVSIGIVIDGYRHDIVGPNLLQAQSFGVEGPIEPEHWADIAWCEVDDPAIFAARAKDCQIPIVAFRTVDCVRFNPAEMRQKCDQLQADLAPYGDFAGYVCSY
jgi:hypothetical protein